MYVHTKMSLKCTVSFKVITVDQFGVAGFRIFPFKLASLLPTCLLQAPRLWPRLRQRRYDDSGFSRSSELEASRVLSFSQISLRRL